MNNVTNLDMNTAAFKLINPETHKLVGIHGRCAEYFNEQTEESIYLYLNDNDKVSIVSSSEYYQGQKFQLANNSSYGYVIAYVTGHKIGNFNKMNELEVDGNTVWKTKEHAHSALERFDPKEYIYIDVFKVKLSIE